VPKIQSDQGLGSARGFFFFLLFFSLEYRWFFEFFFESYVLLYSFVISLSLFWMVFMELALFLLGRKTALPPGFPGRLQVL